MTNSAIAQYFINCIQQDRFLSNEEKEDLYIAARKIDSPISKEEQTQILIFLVSSLLQYVFKLGG